VVLLLRLLAALKLAQPVDMIKALPPRTAMWSHGNVVLLVLLLLGNAVTTIAEAMNLAILLLQEVQHLGPETVDVQVRAVAIPTMEVKMATMLLPQHLPLLLGNNKLPPIPLLHHLVDILPMLHPGTTVLILKGVWVHRLVLLLLLDWVVLVLLLSYNSLQAALHRPLLPAVFRRRLPDLLLLHRLHLISHHHLHPETKQID
jgi:hypothetical protein